MRHRGMTTVPAHCHLEGAGTGHHRPRHHRHFADRDARPVVQAKHRIHRKPLEQAIGDHHRSTPLGLLGGLEDEVHVAVEIQLIPVLSHVARSAEQDRGVPVVPTGMHAPLVVERCGKSFFSCKGSASMSARSPMARELLPFAQDSDDAGSGQTAIDLPVRSSSTREPPASAVRSSLKASSGCA
jgi:hypothetical protein